MEEEIQSEEVLEEEQHVEEEQEVEEEQLAEPEEQKNAPEVKEGDPEGYIKSINKKHREMMDAIREKTALQEELQKLRAQQPQIIRPDIPPPPDPYDADYQDKLKERDQAILKVAEYDARVAVEQQQQQQAMYQAEQEQQRIIGEAINSYEERAKKAGMTQEDIRQTGTAVAAAGMSVPLQMHILQMEEGPLVTSYLATHPNDLEAMRGKSMIECGVYLETVIKEKATAYAGRSRAPAPPDTLGGGGAPRRQRGPKGATFE